MAVLSNSYSIKPQQLGLQIADIYLNESFPGEQPKSDPGKAAGLPGSGSIKPISLSREQLLEYAGNYFSEELETRYTIILRGDKLVTCHWRNSDVPLTPEDKDHFSGDYPMRRLHFMRDTKDRITGFRVTAGRARNVLFRKM